MHAAPVVVSVAPAELRVSEPLADRITRSIGAADVQAAARRGDESRDAAFLTRDDHLQHDASIAAAVAREQS